ncbi:flagellar M-ring protein [Pullulanibacillus camelliae]|uniref:Flagellar M-ring protein n=1 Tax=Pullulanibacillus camelliae TaxID=1707096 RepID=A0A8J2VZX7_9BACL|nr:flagellar basal-body MS-ring/collar protein FliF [Pullulanibacillus camelliae]GGE42110.1 flagellar M-ring protein [Pullulanibacillus camelliae]
MKEKFTTIIHSISDFWKKRSGKQKALFYTAAGIIVIAIVIIVGLNSYKDYVPLYSDLSPSETGQIKDNLDSKGIPYKIDANGTTISVPKKDVNTLKVELASEGIPKTGEIDYSFFSQNTQFGMTDKQFDVLNKAAMETELSNLVKGISGVKSAQVMLNLPEQSDWVSDDSKDASASIVLTLDSGYQLKQEQIQGLYRLVSKSVPNLPEDNIVIMDQYFNYYDQKSDDAADSTLSAYQQQEEVKDNIQKDIQRQVQQMLGMMMGNEKVMVNVSTDVDFTKEKTKEKLVEPVDKDTMDGLKVSTEHITETYKGDNAAGNVTGTGDNQVPEYQGDDNGNGNGDYEHVEDRVNNAFNHITNDIEKSPYELKDLGIQVMVEPPNPNDPNSLPQQRIDDIKGILDTIVKTSLNNGDQLTQDQLDSKSVITVDKFNGKPKATAEPTKKGKPWVYIIAGIVAALIIALIIWLLMRGRRQRAEEEDYADVPLQQDPVPDLLADARKQTNPEEQKRTQLESLAKDNPSEFAKLLRTWFADD